MYAINRGLAMAQEEEAFTSLVSSDVNICRSVVFYSGWSKAGELLCACLYTYVYAHCCWEWVSFCVLAGALIGTCMQIMLHV